MPSPRGHRSRCAVLFLSASLAATSGCNEARPLANGETTDCLSCHGSDGNPAPPRGTRGETSTTAAAVGAHRLHLRDTAIRQALACTECHVVPARVVDAGPLRRAAADLGPAVEARGGQPSWNQAELRCSGVYCHGGSPAIHGGSSTAPVWTYATEPDFSLPPQQTCTTCHGWPPPAPHPQNTDCRRCHGTTVLAGGTIDVAGGKHVNGATDFSGGDGTLTCSSCHGSADSPAPPTGLGGETATTEPARRRPPAPPARHAHPAGAGVHRVPRGPGGRRLARPPRRPAAHLGPARHGARLAAGVEPRPGELLRRLLPRRQPGHPGRQPHHAHLDLRAGARLHAPAAAVLHRLPRLAPAGAAPAADLLRRLPRHDRPGRRHHRRRRRQARERGGGLRRHRRRGALVRRLPRLPAGDRRPPHPLRLDGRRQPGRVRRRARARRLRGRWPAPARLPVLRLRLRQLPPGGSRRPHGRPGRGGAGGDRRARRQPQGAQPGGGGLRRRKLRDGLLPLQRPGHRRGGGDAGLRRHPGLDVGRQARLRLLPRQPAALPVGRPGRRDRQLPPRPGLRRLRVGPLRRPAGRLAPRRRDGLEARAGDLGRR